MTSPNSFSSELKDYLRSKAVSAKILEQYEYFFKYLGPDCKFAQVCFKLLVPYLESFEGKIHGKR